MQAQQDNRRRAYWLKTLHEWHWISAALCLLGMILFSVTGITLNHASQIEAKPEITSKNAPLPVPLADSLRAQAAAAAKPDAKDARKAPLPAPLQDWFKREWSLDTAGREAEWSNEEVYVSLPRPGGDAWLRIDLREGEAEYELTDRGWVSYFNDLHKGRHTGVAWSWFIDVFAAAALLFSITGLFILKMHAGNRPLTWPVVGLGVIAPFLLAILFIH